MRPRVEFQRRNVIRVAIAYAATSWLILLIGNRVLPAFEAADWGLKAMAVILMAGFPMAVLLAWFFEFTPVRVRRADRAGRARRGSGRALKRLDLAILGILAVAAILSVVGVYIPPERAVVRSHRAPSVAVLPFVNTSSRRDQDLLADGLTEEILNSLARVERLRVAGRASSFAFRGRNDDLRLIGETLVVEHVLEGSVRTSGDTLRVTARLVGVADGYEIWSQAFERDWDGIFEIQRAVAAAVARELSTQLSDAQPQTLNVTAGDAHRLYLLARQRIHAGTQPMLRAAVQLLDRAIAIDRGYAPAYAQRGIAGLLLIEGNRGSTASHEALERSRQFLDIGVMLDARLAEGWAGLGLYYLTRRDDYPAAVEALRKALAINPVLSDAGRWLEQAHYAAGDVEAARATSERMARVDPLYRPALTGAVDTFNRFGEHDKAFALIDKARKVIPDDLSVLMAEGITNLYLGHVVAAYPLLQTAFEQAPGMAAVRSSYGWALIGTRQVERLAFEGDRTQRIAALYHLGRTARAERLARDMATDGFILPLLQHFNRSGQSALAVAYVDQRWSDLDAFEAVYPHDVSGHEEMAELALAYLRTGDPRFEEALQRVGTAINKLAAAGVDNWVFERNRAVYLALGADVGPMLESLGEAIEDGYRDILPLGATRPAFESVSQDPRFALLELRMRNYVERDRSLLGPLL